MYKQFEFRDLAQPIKSYALLDSGDGEKLERFGGTVLARPSSICIWKKRKPQLWRTADAQFVPKVGWRFPKQKFESWQLAGDSFKLQLRLQTNGQIGTFPEHGFYLEAMGKLVSAAEFKSFRVLNLFAYSGMASTFLAGLGAHVCHVDLSKKSLGWAEENLRLNKLDPKLARLICEDSMSFLKKEIKRDKSYNLIIADPPSFGRISANKSWKLLDIITELTSDCIKLLDRKFGALFMTSHDPETHPELLANILSDLSGASSEKIYCQNLNIQESEGARLLPSGQLVALLP